MLPGQVVPTDLFVKTMPRHDDIVSVSLTLCLTENAIIYVDRQHFCRSIICINEIG